ncbi:hypothetical protein [Haliovirga abyssi]|uniref:CD-NTase-associated protein 15 domain-containing protein n=1 Tax=Haliovirga abyssi TaxID=2996794 RepID=A0AAU9DC31_9FUSO|nr:hypothetical protein [Haliovirga abyssi]BDU51036.1 hypothetical protein HLVA_16050 [Haliovirga abyssi]
MEENLKWYIKSIIIISIIIYLLVDKMFVDKSILENIGKTISIVIVLSMSYIHFFWKFNPLSKTPKLHKEYDGFLISEFDGNKREAKIRIVQNLFAIQIYLKTDESESKAIMSKIYTEYGEKFLVYYYLNTPNANVRNRSEIHYGICRLKIENRDRLTGQYFTDRKTLGDIEFESTIS